MRWTRPVAAIVVLPLFAACGGRDEPSGGDEGRPRRSTSTSVAGGASLEVEIALEGAYSRETVHFLRVERPDGAKVLEHRLGPERALTSSLEPGEYRLLSFQRQCKTACVGEPKLSEMGEPIDLCGSYFSVAPAATTRLTVKLIPEEGCEVATG